MKFQDRLQNLRRSIGISTKNSPNLKPLIYDFQVQNRNDTPAFSLKVCTGSVDNIKPELVLASMFAAAGLTYHPEAMQIHKLETYTKNEQGYFIPLDALGENIV